MTETTRQNANLYLLLRQAFPTRLDSWAIQTEDGLVYTWRDLDRASAMLANLLGGLHLPRASRIAVQTEKSVETLLLYLATLRAGHVYLPLNTAYTDAEMGYFIENAQPAVLVCTRARFSELSALAFQRGVGHVYTLDADRSGSLLERAVACADVQTPVHCDAADLATIIYTSGTTGRSKGAMLSHGNLASNALTLKDYWDWRDDDVLIHALPIFHVHGLFVAIHGALLNGSPMHWFSRFEPRAVLERFAESTVFMGVPTLYVRLLKEPGLMPDRCRAMRLFISGSAPLLAETHRAWQTRTGHQILERYGMSETVMLTSNPCRDSDGPRVAGTVGPTLPGVSLRITDEQGQIAATGVIGHVEVQGPNVFSGYWQMPEKTAQEFTADGWFKTGDVGRLDRSGYLEIVGRSKDLVITGGYNVYPAEIEGVLNEWPGIEESAVIGVPHGDFGEAVVAVVVTRSHSSVDPDALLSDLKSRLANYKVPKKLLCLDELPRNAMGKVQKAALRERYRALFTE
jgi:malonyl-CoA/methylmalonyl-CoA synthetase